MGRNKVRVYDNGGKTADRYTVLIFRQEHYRRVADVYGMDEKANKPDGFNQYSQMQRI